MKTRTCVRKRLVGVAVIAAAGLVLGACASTPHEQSAKVAANGSSHEHLVCFRDSALGSHIAQVHCMTQQEFKQFEKSNAASAKALQNAVNNGNTSQNNNSGGGGE